ncbi:MAG TPA: hypothetical protein VG992_04035 [Candidatus Saccharimonadales bacterium]|nr:hypothetical protein [Candidatus Saccharimonadales bacterium]
MRIHFVCRGNAYRSRMAEAYMRAYHPDVEVTSSGTCADAHRAENDPELISFTDDFLRRQGVDVAMKQHPSQLTADRLQSDDFVICMNQLVASEFVALLPHPPVYETWDIADTGETSATVAAGLGVEAHTKAIYKEIVANCERLLTTGLIHR